MAFSFICLTLSRVKPNSSPISFRVRAYSLFIPKYILITSCSRSFKLVNEAFTSSSREDSSSSRSGSSVFPSAITSNKQLLSSSENGVSNEWCLLEILWASLISVDFISNCFPSSSALGALS